MCREHVEKRRPGKPIAKKRTEERERGNLRDLDAEVGRDGSGNVGISADISIGLKDNVRVLLDEQVKGGLKSSTDGLDSAGLKTSLGGHGAAEHGEHGHEEGEDSEGSHYGC